MTRNKSKKGGKKAKGRGGKTLQFIGTQSDTATLKVVHRSAFRASSCLGALTRNLNPFPPCWRTTMCAEITGSIAIGAAATNHFNVAFNSPYLPFNTANPWPGAVGGFAAATAIPAGYSALTGALGPYIAYRCYGSAIKVEMVPTAAADTVSIACAPRIGNVFDNYSACAQSKWAKGFLANLGSGEKSFTNAMSVCETSGDIPDALNSNSGFAAAYNALPTYYGEWETWYETTGGAVFTGTVGYKVSVAWDLAFENPQYDRSELDSVSVKEEFMNQRKSAIAASKRDPADENNRHIIILALKKKAKEEEEARYASIADMTLSTGYDDEKSSVPSSNLSSSAVRPVLARRASGLKGRQGTG